MLYFGLHWSEQLRVAPTIELTAEQEGELTRLARSKLSSVRLAQRARIAHLWKLRDDGRVEEIAAGAWRTLSGSSLKREPG
jgi:hypothetical protein